MNNLKVINRANRFNIMTEDKEKYTLTYKVGEDFDMIVNSVCFERKEFEQFIYIKLHNDSKIMTTMPDNKSIYPNIDLIENKLYELFEEFIVDKLRISLYSIPENYSL